MILNYIDESGTPDVPGNTSHFVLAGLSIPPLFVDSQLTSMIQLADVCGYALRRFLEKGEDYLFNHVFKLADKKQSKVVGVRHFTTLSCVCRICQAHR